MSTVTDLNKAKRHKETMLMDKDFLAQADQKLILDEAEAAPKEILFNAFKSLLETYRRTTMHYHNALQEVGRLQVENSFKNTEIIKLMQGNLH